jgi:hypothetical protein
MFRFAAILSAISLVFASAKPAYCQEDNIALMLQLSPVEGGKVNIEPGVHMYERDSIVTLRAVANPGYQFVYWIGDVIEPSAGTTILNLDGPKIVIAVFERSKFEILEAEEKPQFSVGGGRLYRSRVERGSGASGAIVYRPPSFNFPKPPHKPPVPEGSDPPVPEGNDPPVPVPEPATVLYFLFIIFYFLFKSSTNRRPGYALVTLNRKLKIENLK